jgi:hypothetical protein
LSRLCGPVEEPTRLAERLEGGGRPNEWCWVPARWVPARWRPVNSPATRWIPVFNWVTAAAALFAIAAFLSGDLLVGNRQPELASPAASPGVETAVGEGGAPVVESDFIPLPNAAQIGPNEEVNLVRVEVPRSAMIALGYSLKPEEASESVQADVMLGNDGLARAVRFLD